MTDPLLTISDVCRLLQVKRNTLFRWRKNPAFPRALKIGPGRSGRVMFAQADILTWLSEIREGMAAQEITARPAVVGKADGEGKPVRTLIISPSALAGGRDE